MAWRLRFYRGVFGLIFRLGGGRIEFAIYDRAHKLDRTARSQPLPHHNQPVYAGAGAGTVGDGVAASFLQVDFGRFFDWGVG